MNLGAKVHKKEGNMNLIQYFLNFEWGSLQSSTTFHRGKIN